MSRVQEANQRRIETNTETVLVDIVGYSRLDAEAQYRTAILINVELEKITQLSATLSAVNLEQMILGFVPTGDGFYVVLHPKQIGNGVLFAASLRSALLGAARRNANLFSGVRLSVHCGHLFVIIDITGRRNFVGPAMNECARMMHIGLNRAPRSFLTDGNSIFASRASVNAFEKRFLDAPDDIEKLRYHRTDWITYTDKHEMAHEGAFVELSTGAAWLPMKEDEYEARVREKMEEMLGHIERHRQGG